MTKIRSGVQTLDRAFALLEIVAAAQEPLGLKEVTAQAGLPKPTVYRLLSSLETWGYVEQKYGYGYQLGTKLLTLGGRVQARLKITEVARPYLKTLNDATKETIFLGIMDQGRSLYVAKLDSHHSVRLASGVGSRNYLHSTSLGKCLLAGLAEDEIKRLAQEQGLPRQTVNTITEVDELLAAIAQVKAVGYAIDDRENEEGVRCVAAPIRDHLGNIVAAVSISGPSQKINAAYIEKRLLAELGKAAAGVSQALGYVQKE